MRLLLNRRFGTWSDALAFISLFASIVGLFVTLFLVRYPDQIPQYIILRDLGIVLGLIGIIIFLLVRYFHQETIIRYRARIIDEQQRFLSHQFMDSHYLVHNFRSILFKFYFPYLERFSSLSREEETVFYHVCRDITDTVRDTFINYFNSQGIDIGQDISVSVQMIVTAETAIEQLPNLTEDKKRKLQTRREWIITVYRDSYTYTHHRERKKLRRIYDISARSNTAFHHILELGYPYFVENDLQEMAERGLYRNENPDWKGQYNSTIVMPIRYRDAEDSQDYIPYGLLTVDSLNEEGRKLYNDNECRNIVGQAADLLAMFFLLPALSKYKPIEFVPRIQVDDD